MNELCGILLSWIFMISDYKPIDAPCPDMQMVSHEWLANKACDGNMKCNVLGLYPGDGEVIYIDDRLDIEGNTFYSSIALHELVHWLQYKNGKSLMKCDAVIKNEKEAYNIQGLYLQEYGIYYPTMAVIPLLHCEE